MYAEIRAQRTHIGQLLGQLRDAEGELTGEDVQPIATEKTTFKQRVRQLTVGNRTPRPNGWKPYDPATGLPAGASLSPPGKPCSAEGASSGFPA